MSRLDRLKTVYGYYANKHSMGTYPMLVGMELTNHCDLKCIMCPQPNQTRSLGLMKLELFKKVVDEVRGRSEFMYLHGLGESLLHPKFFEMADYAHKAGLKTHLSTNMSFLNEERSEKLVKSNIDFIVMSMDGATKETYESIRVGGDFERNLKQAKYFLRLKRETNARSHVVVQFIQMEKNKGEVGHVKELFSEEERKAVNMFRVKPVFDSPSFVTEDVSHHNPCYFLWSTMDITQDGLVKMCCMDFDAKVVFGDLNKQSVFEVWNSPGMAELRAKHKRLDYKSMPICDKCDLPEKNYFSNGTILASAIFDAGNLRKGLALYEKLFISKSVFS